MAGYLSDKYEAETEGRFQVLSELFIWLFFSLLLTGRFWLGYISYRTGSFYSQASLTDIIQAHYVDILVGLMVIIFPYLYRAIFGYYPFQHIRYVKRLRNEIPEYVRLEGNISEKKVITSIDREVDSISQGIDATSDPESILAALARSSEKLSERILSRAGVNLLLGIMIAFSGLAFFYLQTAGTANLTSTVNDLVLKQKQSLLAVSSLQVAALAPRFGILFFIEFVAFFFLRQYRSAMDEFRYFESIKRSREEIFVMVRLMKSENGKVDIEQLLKMKEIVAANSKLGSGETTELLETKKLSKDEMDLFTKIIEAVSVAKK